ncbi:MAG: DUF3299 domain-containing protein [Paracoccaceae bacterium]
MPNHSFTRRNVMALVSGGIVAQSLPVWADAPIELRWTDLVPKEQGEAMARIRELGVVQHGQMSSPFQQQTTAQLTREYDGKMVRLPGYMVPLDYDGTGVTTFILVPYVGACIHVPPPPPNQLVFVETETPYEARGLFEPIYVTGTFGAAATATQLAEIGYSIQATLVEPYS